MGNQSVGIDISHYQPAIPGGPWLFAVHQATEGSGFSDPTFAGRYEALRMVAPIVGAYHYARPLQSNGVSQANRFADTAIAAGFKPGIDIWQLDAEDGENGGISNPLWFQFIEQFMQQAEVRLGKRGFLYAGWPFLVAHGLATLATKYNWWLPDYSVNDGNVHPVQTPAAYTPYVVIHQFTSHDSLDQNVVQNVATWDALFAPVVNWNFLAKIAAFLKSVGARKIHYGERGARVAKLHELLRKHGYHNCTGEVYNARTAAAVADFKRRKGQKNRDGRYVGKPCMLKLLQP